MNQAVCQQFSFAVKISMKLNEPYQLTAGAFVPLFKYRVRVREISDVKLKVGAIQICLFLKL